MKRIFWFYVVLFFAGVAIVAFPDSGEPIFMLSESHGPSVLDMAGLVAMLWPWTAMLGHAFRRWRYILQTIGGPLLAALVMITLSGYLILAVSIRSDSYTWIIGALMAFVGQMIPIIVAFGVERRK